jgi:two-component system cell cycle response regulator CpdR
MNALLEAVPAPVRGVLHPRADTAKILYAEDDEVIRTLTALLLTRTGYAVSAVENGLRAWETLRHEPFDLLITDNEMPYLTGLELVTRARLEGFDLPILVASASVDQFLGAGKEWLQLAATLGKPFAPDELLGCVRQVLRAAGGMRAGHAIFVPSFARPVIRIQPPRHWGIND